MPCVWSIFTVENDYVKELVQLGVIFLGLMICDIVIC